MGQERFDKEGVVAIITVQADVSHVVVHFEVVVSLAPVVSGVVEPGALGDFLDDRDYLALHQHVLGHKHRANVELVIALVPKKVDLGRRIVGDELVRAVATEHGDLLDREIIDDLEVCASREARLGDLHQALFIVDVLLFVAGRRFIEMTDDQSIGMIAKGCPAIVLELAVVVLTGEIHRVKLNRVMTFTSGEDELVDAAGAGVVNIEELLATDAD